MLNLGDITFGLGADHSGLGKARDNLRAFGREVDKVAKIQSAGANVAMRAMNSQERAMRSAIKATADLQTKMRGLGADPGTIGRSTQALNAYVKALSSGKLNAVEFTRATDRFNSQQAKFKGILNDLIPDDGKKAGKFSAVLKEIGSSATLAMGPLSGIGSRVGALSALMGKAESSTLAFSLGITTAVGGAALLGSAAIKAGQQVQSIKAAFQVSSGSALAANKEFEYTVAVSQRLGLELGSTAKQYSLFSAAAKGTALEGKGARVVLEGIGSATRALNLTQEQSEGTWLALTQVMSKGKVQAEEIRGQLAERIPGAFRIAAASVGKTTQEFDAMLKKGQVMSNDFLPKFAAKLQEVFGPQAALNSNNLSANMERVKTSVLLFSDAFDKASGASAAFNSVLKGVVSFVDMLTANMSNFVGIIGAVTGGVVGFAAAWAAARLPTMIAGVVSLTKSMRELAIAEGLASLAAGGVWQALGKIAVVGGAAAAGYYLFNKAANDGSTAMAALDAETQSFIASQGKVVTATKETTQNYIDAVIPKIKEAQTELARLREEEANPRKFGALADDPKRIEAFQKTRAEVLRLQDSLQKLQTIYKSAIDPSQVKDIPTVKLPKFKPKQFDSALDQLDEMQRKVTALNQSPDAFKAFEKAVAREHELRSFSNALKESHIDTATATQLTNEYMKAWDQLPAAQKHMDDMVKAQEAAKDLAKEFADAGKSAFGSFADDILKLRDRTVSLGDAFQSLVMNILDGIAKVIMQHQIVTPLANAFEGLVSGVAGSFFGTAAAGASSGASTYNLGGGVKGYAAPIAGHRATGGQVTAGKTYMVGEKGPEPFVPSQSGTILPNSSMGGGGSTVVNVNVVNNTNSNVSVRQNENGNGKDITVIIDEMIAKQISTPSSKAARAVKNLNSQKLAGR